MSETLTVPTDMDLEGNFTETESYKAHAFLAVIATEDCLDVEELNGF
jgi:hypothetical protein